MAMKFPASRPAVKGRTYVTARSPSESIAKTGRNTRLLPGVQFHRIAVHQHEDVRLLQLSNSTIIKGWLEQPGSIPMLIDGLKKIVKPYKKIGLVTYKTIGKDDQFATTLAQAIGAKVWAHFGNLRGINTMEDVDCLLVVGRHSLQMDTMQDYARAIFGSDTKWERRIYADQPVRMKNGKTFRLNTQIRKDPYHQAVYDHTSLAETLQAIGRGRPVHGPKKDIYVFSNENLAINTEVAEFFPFERYFERPVAASRKPAVLVTAAALDRVWERGFVQLKAADLMEQLGLTAFQVKAPAKKDQIAGELIANGAVRIDAVVRYRKGQMGPRTYVVFDMAKLKQALVDDGERLVEWRTVASDECLAD